MSNLFVNSSSISPTKVVFNKENIVTLYRLSEQVLNNSAIISSLGLSTVIDPVNSYSANTCVLIANVDQSGSWTSSWISESDYQGIFNQQQNEFNIRRQRNILLSACDWTQTTDSPLSSEKKTAWSTYRQALRDITNQAGFPNSITWPVKPV